MTVTLGGLVVFFMMAVIVLAVKNRKLQTGNADMSFVAHPVVTDKAFGR